ncbi:hypothetical protein AVEN_78712-1 [Araneus ventricosus]|uniref:Uncharacterized protein n=2 Tax=Araneus ventricosus TaxID=182803 RepID=A0A4Y2UT42_ARAVE|nr:hypothetical protein AVEN_78712-1 [Araneus ventricosus]
MKPLLAAVVALLLMVHFETHDAAPQPLPLLNTTDTDDLIETSSTTDVNKDNEDRPKSTTLESLIDGVPTEASSGNASEKTAGEDSKEVVDTTFGGSDVVESRSDSNEPSEKIADETTISEVNKDDAKFATSGNEAAVGSTTGISTTEAKVFSDDPKPLVENSEEIVKNDEIPEVIMVSRYVPPLDPMKHMLMMAEVRKQQELSASTTEASSTNPPTTTKLSSTNPPATTEISSTNPSETTEVSSTNPPTTTEEIPVAEKVFPEEVEKHAAESFDVEKIAVSTVDPTTSSPNNPTVVVKYADDIISSEADIISTSESSQTTEKNKVTESSSTALITESTPIDVSSSHTLDMNHESSVLIHSSELFSGKNESSIVENSTNLNETFYSDSTEQAQTYSPTELTDLVSSTETYTTDSPHSSTDIKSEESMEEASLVRSDDEIDSVEISEAEESSSLPTEPTEIADVSDERQSETSFNEAPSTPVFNSDSEVLTTTKPEVETEVVNEKLLASEDEAAKNVTLEESEFKEEPSSFNTSEIIEGENLTDSPVEIAESRDSDSSSSVVDLETTTQNILTTLRDIVFGFSTATPEKDIDSPKSESTDLNLTSSESEIPSEPVMDSESNDNAEIRSESELPVDNPTSDIMKVELEVSSIDSISTEVPSAVFSTVPDEETKSDLKDDSSTTISNEEALKYSPEKEQEFSNNTDEKDSILFEDFTETTSVPEILSTVETPLKSELLESSDPVTASEVSSDVPTKDDFKPEENQTVKLDTKDRYVSGNNSDMVAAVQFLHYHDKASSEQCFKLVDAHWKYATNLTDDNKKKQVNVLQFL